MEQGMVRVGMGLGECLSTLHNMAETVFHVRKSTQVATLLRLRDALCQSR